MFKLAALKWILRNSATRDVKRCQNQCHQSNVQRLHGYTQCLNIVFLHNLAVILAGGGCSTTPIPPEVVEPGRRQLGGQQFAYALTPVLAMP